MRNDQLRKACQWVEVAVLVLLLVSAVLTMTGCASGTMPMQAVQVVQASAHPVVRQSLLDPCADVGPVTTGRLADLLSNHVDVALALADCRQSKADLVDALRGQKGIDVLP